ncbi:NTP transferase domain-containing protein [Candidatus Woesearchaeota archaeon]|nr:NTP transferase domain-containing protein [Candidatus Woesearchaeota archaeon]
MKAVILGAGYGTRLYKTAKEVGQGDFVMNTPKPLLPIGEKPLINFILDRLSDIAVNDVTVISNSYYRQQFDKWWGVAHKQYNFNIGLKYNNSESWGENRGAVVDMCLAAGLRPNSETSESLGLDSYSHALTDDYIILLGDRLPTQDLDLGDMVKLMQDKNSSVIGVTDTGSMDKMKGKSQVKYDPDGRVTLFEEKSPAPVVTTTCPGFYFLKKEDFALITNFLEEEVAKGNTPDAPGYFIQYLFDNNVPLYAFEVGKPHDIGSWDSYQEAIEIFGGK